jgi:hypothetical protein
MEGWLKEDGELMMFSDGEKDEWNMVEDEWRHGQSDVNA